MHEHGAVSNVDISHVLTWKQDSQAVYSEDLMNLEENLFALDAESRELIFGRIPSVWRQTKSSPGRTGMGDSSAASNSQYDGSTMHPDPNELNNMLSQMPTPVSNDIRASQTSSLMSPLQVDQQNYERMNGVQFSTHSNDEVPTLA
jgi:hypothetical protein